MEDEPESGKDLEKGIDGDEASIVGEQIEKTAYEDVFALDEPKRVESGMDLGGR